MKIAYVGFDLMYSAAEYLVKAGHEILKIYTCKCDNITEFNRDLIKLAEENQIPYTMERIKLSDLEWLKEQGCELLISAAYYYLIPTPDNYEEKFFPMLNIHPAPLPGWRGPWPMPLMILREEKKSAVTIHKLEKTFDTGDIVSIKEFALSTGDPHASTQQDSSQNNDSLSAGETLTSYMKKVNQIIPGMLEEILGDFETYVENARPQGEGRYWEEPGEEMYTIRPDMTAKEVNLIQRAFAGYVKI